MLERAGGKGLIIKEIEMEIRNNNLCGLVDLFVG